MTILRMNNCKHCNRPAILKELSGGWSIWCMYSDPIACVEAWGGENYCDEYEHSEQMYNDPTSAIVMWNIEHRLSGISHDWEFLKKSVTDNVLLWKCPNCLEVTWSWAYKSLSMSIKNCRPDLKERRLRNLKS